MKAAWVLILLCGCGGSVVDDLPGDGGTRKDAARDVATHDRTSAPIGKDATTAPDEDAYPVFHDDACASLSTDPPPRECDPFSTQAQCNPGDGCYPVPPRAVDACHPGLYGTRCRRAGAGSQGSPCSDGSDCGGGFICVKSAAGDQCVKLCLVSANGACGDGRICREVDVTGSGYGGCE